MCAPHGRARAADPRPVTAEGTTYTQRSRLPARSGSIAAGHRWDLVYAAEQLARRPAPGTLSPPTVPALTPAEWNQAVRHGAGRMLGRTLDGSTTLTATSRCWPPRHRSGRPDPARRSSAARPGRLAGRRPGRDGVRTDADVRPVVDVTAGALADPRRRPRGDGSGHPGRVAQHRRRSHRQPTPRVDASDDREVAPTRRNLSPADVRGLPIGVWVESGPYTAVDGRRRRRQQRPGRPSPGQRPFLPRGLRGPLGSDVATRRPPAAAPITAWLPKAPPSRSRTPRWPSGRRRERFPDAARSVDASVQAPVAPHHGWVPLQGGATTTEGRVFDERVSAMISPGRVADGRHGCSPTGDRAKGRSPPAPTTPASSPTPSAAALMTRRPQPRPSQHDDPGPRRRRNPDPPTSTASSAPDSPSPTGSLTAPNTHQTGSLSCSAQPAPSGPPPWLRCSTTKASTRPRSPDIPAIGLRDSRRRARAARPVGHRPPQRRRPSGRYPDDLRGGGMHDRRDAPSGTREVLRQLDTRTHTWELAAHTLLEAGMSPGEAVRQPRPRPDPRHVRRRRLRDPTGPGRSFPVAVRKQACPTSSPSRSATASPPPRRPRPSAPRAATLVHVVHGRCEGDMPATLEACAAVLPGGVADEPVGTRS